MSVVTTLQEARELILKAEHWTTEAFARDTDGGVIREDSPQACQWCAVGAVRKAAGFNRDEFTQPKYFREARQILDEGARSVGGYGATSVNDECGHSVTLDMFDAAIAIAKGRGL